MKSHSATQNSVSSRHHRRTKPSHDTGGPKEPRKGDIQHQVGKLFQHAFENEGIPGREIEVTWNELSDHYLNGRIDRHAIDNLLDRTSKNALRSSPNSKFHINRLVELFTVRLSRLRRQIADKQPIL
jgi:hypothetical protein